LVTEPLAFTVSGPEGPGPSGGDPGQSSIVSGAGCAGARAATAMTIASPSIILRSMFT
jgi:hypothetical protein